MKEAVEQRRTQLMEIAAESHDELIEKYLGGEELTEEEIRKGLEEGVCNGTLIPVLCGAAAQNIGVDYLLKFFVDYTPSPVEMPTQTGKNLAKLRAEYREAQKRETLIGMILENKVLDIIESKSKITES